METKRQLIEDIRRYNTQVAPEFLLQFDDEALQQYLEHLKVAQQRNVRIAGWVRTKSEPKLRMVS